MRKGRRRRGVPEWKKTACAGRQNKCQSPVREKTRSVLSPVRLSRRSLLGASEVGSKMEQRNGALGLALGGLANEKNDGAGGI